MYKQACGCKSTTITTLRRLCLCIIRWRTRLLRVGGCHLGHARDDGGDASEDDSPPSESVVDGQGQGRTRGRGEGEGGAPVESGRDAVVFTLRLHLLQEESASVTAWRHLEGSMQWHTPAQSAWHGRTLQSGARHRVRGGPKILSVQQKYAKRKEKYDSGNAQNRNSVHWVDPPRAAAAYH